MMRMGWGGRNPILRWLVFVLAISACGSGAGNNRLPLQRNPRPDIEAPLFLFALDGFEWSVILPLLREGRLPALESLIDRGHAGQIKPLLPTLSPRLWATIATGKLPHVHGIEDFVREVDGKTYAYRSTDRRVKAFWNILSEYGLSSDTIGWWTTYPVEAVHGTMVAQVNTTQAGRNIEKGTLVDGLPDQVWPVEENERVFALLRQVEAEIPDRLREVFGDFEVELNEEQRERWQQCQWAFCADALYASIAIDRLERDLQPDLLSLYLGGTDVVGHRFWAAHAPEDSRRAGIEVDHAEQQAFGGVIRSYYVWVDGLLGRLLELLAPETTVLVVSDHGMVLNEDSSAEDSWTEFTGVHFQGEAGAFVAAGTGIAAAPTNRPAARALKPIDLPVLGGIFDVCPTLLVLMGVPFGRDMHGRPLEAILDPDFLQRHPPQLVPSLDDKAWLRSRRAVPAVEEAAERLEQLRNLGYLGDETENE